MAPTLGASQQAHSIRATDHRARGADVAPALRHHVPVDVLLSCDRARRAVLELSLAEDQPRQVRFDLDHRHWTGSVEVVAAGLIDRAGGGDLTVTTVLRMHRRWSLHQASPDTARLQFPVVELVFVGGWKPVTVLAPAADVAAFLDRARALVRRHRVWRCAVAPRAALATPDGTP